MSGNQLGAAAPMPTRERRVWPKCRPSLPKDAVGRQPGGHKRVNRGYAQGCASPPPGSPGQDHLLSRQRFRSIRVSRQPSQPALLSRMRGGINNAARSDRTTRSWVPTSVAPICSDAAISRKCLWRSLSVPTLPDPRLSPLFAPGGGRASLNCTGVQ
jgi:hypothetical protein